MDFRIKSRKAKTAKVSVEFWIIYGWLLVFILALIGALAYFNITHMLSLRNVAHGNVTAASDLTTTTSLDAGSTNETPWQDTTNNLPKTRNNITPTTVPVIIPTTTLPQRQASSAESTTTTIPQSCQDDGIMYHGSCWHVGKDAESCDDVCNKIGFSCDLSDAVQWIDADCRLLEYLGIDCTDACNGVPSGSINPAYLQYLSSNACYYRTARPTDKAAECAAFAIHWMRICPCA